MGSDKSVFENCWCSDNKPNQYVDIEFKTHYLNVKGMFNNNFTFNKFSLQGSNSTDNYIDIYTHDGTTVAPKDISLFSCQYIETFNHFRLKLLSPTKNPESWHFIIGAIEFFGYDPHHTCLNKKQPKNFILINVQAI